MSLCISPNCFSRRLTSAVVVPLPAAMRRRRLALMSSGWRRSSGVIESMIASIRLNWPSSTACWAAPAICPAPGIICSTWPIGPIFLTWSSWLRKSSSVKR